MREIKYKVWHIEHKKWIHDELDIFLTSDGDVYEKYDYGYETCIRDITNAVEILFFTGLKDKNGKEIYEGNIARKDNVIYEVLWVESSAKFGVKVTVTDYVLSKGLAFPIPQYVVDGTMQCNLEVIGNIYENPDLIKKAE